MRDPRDRGAQGGVEVYSRSERARWVGLLNRADGDVGKEQRTDERGVAKVTLNLCLPSLFRQRGSVSCGASSGGGPLTFSPDFLHQ